MWLLLVGAAGALVPAPARGQWMGKQTGCGKPGLTANPNRPTVANPADITQYGVLELEYGWDRTSLDAGARVTTAGGLLKFAMLCDIELRWTMTNYIGENTAAGGQQGTGDNWFGSQIRFYKQTPRVPSMAVSYAAKFPSASTAKGLGSGRYDHELTFLASKDFGQSHFDFNASWFFIGRAAASGYDSDNQINLAFSHPLVSGLGFTAELYGNTQLNAATPGFASSLWALTYTILPRLVVDGGIDVGITHGAPQKRFFAGFTFSIVDVYRLGRRSPEPAKPLSERVAGR